MVTVGSDALDPFPRFARYNSPYAAHRDGRAIDLYPGTETAPSPVAGTVTETLRTRAPSRAYAAEHDHLVVIDTGSELARILHVDPIVDVGETVELGQPLGKLVRSGYFAPWVDNHLHLGFRAFGTDPIRASGSLPLDLGVSLAGVSWDGTGIVRDTGGTYAILDAPAHPDPGAHFVGIADDSGERVFDGGLPHYETGGVHTVGAGPDGQSPVRLFGTELALGSGTIEWADVTVRANGEAITGLSFCFSRDGIGAKLICPGHGFERGERVTVSLESTDRDDPPYQTE